MNLESIALRPVSGLSFAARLLARLPVVLCLVLALGLAAQGATYYLAGDYLPGPLDVSEDTTLVAARAFTAVLGGPLTGTGTLTMGVGIVGGCSGTLQLINRDGNTFSGDIVLDVSCGTMTLGGNLYYSSGNARQGLTLPDMSAANSITVRRGPTFRIEDNMWGNANGYVANRLGTEGDRPALRLAGGNFYVNGPGAAVETTQTVGLVSLESGSSSITVIRNNSSATPKLFLTGLTCAPGATINFVGTSLGTAATKASQIFINPEPALQSGLIGGYARVGNDWATYGAYGVRALPSYSGTIQGAGAADNVRVTAAQTITGNNTINSLVWNHNSTLNLGTNGLTLVSGGYIKQNGNHNYLTNGYVTAGSGDGVLTPLHMYVNAGGHLYLCAQVLDNTAGSGNPVALARDGPGSGVLCMYQKYDNDYSGGTYVNLGTLQTGTADNLRYLGKGPVLVDNAGLVLQAAGATENASGADYTAINGGQVTVSGVEFREEDTFYIGPYSIIAGSASANIGLNSLVRGTIGGSGNVELAADAIVARGGLTLPLDLGYGTIKNLGSSADLFYGLYSDQGSYASASVTLGAGTPFKGISTDRASRRWYLGTIEVAAGTDEIYLMGLTQPGVVVNTLYLGNGLSAGGPVIMPAGAGTVNVNIIGYVILDDDMAVFGDSSSGKAVNFVVTRGATLTLNQANALGSGTGVASVTVESGGTLSVAGNPACMNGAVTIKAGGRLLANNAGGLTGAGALSFETGAILEIATSALGFSGPQAAAATFESGVIVRMNIASIGSPANTLDSYIGGKAPVYEPYGAENWPAVPAVAGTTVLTLNRGADGSGGMLVNDSANRTLSLLNDPKVVIGPNGGAMAATKGKTLTVAQGIEFGANELVIGSAEPLDGFPERHGTITLSAPAGHSTAEEGSRILVITNAILRNAADAIPDEADIVVDGAFSLGAKEGVGSLSGGGRVILGSTLTVGLNGKSTSFSGDFASAGTIVKTGTGRFDIVSSVTNTGEHIVNGGTLAFSGNGRQLATNATTAAYTLFDGGTLLLDNSVINDTNRLAGHQPGITFKGGTFRFIGKDGEASREELGQATFSRSASKMEIVNGAGAGSSSEIRFSTNSVSAGTINFTASNGTFGDNIRVYFTANMPPSAVVPYATVGNLPAYYDATYGIRAYTIAEGTEFNGTAVQTSLDTVYTVNNNHLPLTAARTVKSIWIDSPGEGYAVNLGSAGAYNLTVSSGGINLTGADDFAFVRSGSSSAYLLRGGNQPLYVGVAEPGVTLRIGVPIINGSGGLYKHGAGVLELDAPSTFTGTLVVSDGLARYGASGDLAVIALMTWSDGVFDFAGKTDTLGAVTLYSGFLTNSAAGGALTISTLTFGGGPTGSAARVDTGTGTLKLGGTVTYDNSNHPETAVLDGNVNLNGATRTFTVNDSLASGADIDLDVPAVIAGAAGNGITKNGAGALRLRGINTFNGAVTINNNGGSMVLAHPQAAGTPSATRTFTVGSGSSLVLDGSAGDITVPANYSPLSLNGTGNALLGPIKGALVNWAGINIVQSPITLAADTYLASLSGRLTISGNFNTGTARNLYIFGDGDTELLGVVSTGVNTLSKYGSGTLTLGGGANNTFTKEVYVYGGKLVLNKTGSAYAINNNLVYIYSGGVLQYAAGKNNQINTANVYTRGTGQFDFNGATDTIGSFSNNAFQGIACDTWPLTNSAGGGNLAITALGITPTPGYLTTIDPGTGTLTLGGNVTFTANQDGRAKISGTLDLGGARRAFTVADGTHPNDLHVDAKVTSKSGAYGISKYTAGSRLILSGDNEYTGITYLNAGILRAQDNPKALGACTATNALQLNYNTYMELAGDTGVDFGRNTSLIGRTDSSYGWTQITSDRSTPGAGVTHSLGSLIIGSRYLHVKGGTNVSSGVAGVSFKTVALTNNAYFVVTNTVPGATTLLVLGDITNHSYTMYFQGNGDARINGNLGKGPVKNGALVKEVAGTLTLAAANEYTGNTRISNAGRIVLSHELAAQNTRMSNNVHGGLAFGEGTAFTLGALAGPGNIALSNAAGEAVTLTIGKNNISNISYTGQFSGPGGVRKIGTGTQILANVTLAQYEGNTEVSEGVLRLYTNFLSASGDVILSKPGRLYLNFRATNAVRHLHVDGAKRFGGLYSSNNLPDHIMGTGVLLTEAPPELLCMVQPDKTMGDKSEWFTFSGLYSGNNTNIIAYAWDLDDNGSVDSTGPTVSRQYAVSGDYKVRLTVTNELMETATYLWTGYIFLYPHNTRTWDGGGTNSYASLPANWDNNTAPVPGDHIKLNATSHKNMTWNLNIPVQTWTQVGYNGTVTVATVFGTAGFTNFTILGDCIISNGAWTHLANPAGQTEVYRLKAVIGGNLTIGSNAIITAYGIGFVNGYGPGYGIGGAYGGIGINGYSSVPGGGRTYGSIVAPTNLGSGGNSYAGGPAGGAIWLTVCGALQHHGIVNADALHGGASRGTGGSVYLVAGSMSGSGGIRANGGTVTVHGPGGGGRVSLVVTNEYEDFSLFTGRVTAYGGNNASAGTVYRETAFDPKDKGELIIDNNGQASYYNLPTDLNGREAVTCEFTRIVVTNYGVLGIGPDDVLIATNAVFLGSGANYNDGITINGGSLFVRPDFAYTNLFIRISTAGSTFSPASSLTIADNAELRLDQPHSMTCNVIVAEGGRINHTANISSHTEYYKAYLSLNGNFFVQSGGLVDVSGRGFPANYGPGMNTYSSGASHGGQGVNGNSCYGSIVFPTNLGSGAWSGSAGGGSVRMSISGVFKNEGNVRANATERTANTGSGGTINITAGAMSGSGSIEANSATNVTGSYPGGGGRIALTVTNAGEDFSDYYGSITAYGGRSKRTPYTTYPSGGAGTIYLRDAGQGLYEGSLFVKNDNMTGIGTEISTNVRDAVVGNVDIRDGGILLINNSQSLTLSGDWDNKAGFTGLTDSAVIFAGPAASTSTVYGNTTFSGFICTNGLGKTIRFQPGFVNSIGAGGRFVFAGAPDATNLFLRSMSDGAPWYLDVSPMAEQLVSCVDVKDSDALLGAEVIAANSRDRGGNVNWKFLSIYPGEAITWTGGSNTVWSQAENWDLARMPMDSDVIVIPGGCKQYPELDADRVVHVIDLRRGASLALNGWDLVVTNMLSVAGTLAASGTETITLLKDADFTGGAFDAFRSTLLIAGVEAQSLNLAGATFFNILVENSVAPMTFYGGFTATELRCEASAGTRELVFEPGSTVKLRDMVLQGAAANIALRSTTPGRQWRLAVSGYRSIRGVDVRDSDASPGLPVTAVLSKDSGGNVNWIFDAEWSEWLGLYGTSFHVSSNWASGVVPGSGSRVLVETGNPMVISKPVQLLDLTIGGGAATAKVTANAELTMNETIIVLTNGTLALNRPTVIRNDMVLFGGAKLTHTTNNTTEVNKIDLLVHGNVAVDVNATVNVTAMGYRNGYGPGYGTGGGYGGRGSDGYSGGIPSGPCYGSFIAPTNLGTGGNSYAGGYGGGAIIMRVLGELRHDGTMFANGEDGGGNRGAGGAIFLTAGSMRGIGSLQANGANLTVHSSGGGGRISLVVTNMGADFARFTGPIKAFSGMHLPAYVDAKGGGAGTIYLKEWADRPGRGTVLVNNNNASNTGPTDVPPRSHYTAGEVDFVSFRVSNAARLSITADVTVGDIWLDTANARLDLGGHTLTVRTREHPLGPGSVLNPGQIIWLPEIPRGTIYFAK